MKLISGRHEVPTHPPTRAIRRNCGQLLGHLDALLPCLYIAHYGVSPRVLRQQWTVSAPGLFAAGEVSGGDHGQVAPRLGLLLPLGLCGDEQARAALLDIAARIAGSSWATVSDKRREVQARLDAAFSGDLRLAHRETLGGSFALVPSADLFRRLCESFEYVTEVADDATDGVRVSQTAPFRWRTHGELMEWFHAQFGPDRQGCWSVLTPILVTGPTAALYSYATERWAREGLARPAEEPAKWFVLRPGLSDAKVGVRLQMREYGWASLHLAVGDTSTEIRLSDVFDPFPELVAWGREIDEGDLPVQMEIDEEGREAVLTVLGTDDPERVLLRVSAKGEDAILLEGVVSRAALASALKAELIRFFTSEFDPEHWDLRDDGDEDDDHDQRKDAVLNHPWIAANR